MAGCVLGKGHTERYRGTGERPLKLQEASGVGLSHLPWWHSLSFKHPFSLLLWLGIPTRKCVSLSSTSDPHEHLQWPGLSLIPNSSCPSELPHPHLPLEPWFFQCAHAFVTSARNVLTTWMSMDLWKDGLNVKFSTSASQADWTDLSAPLHSSMSVPSSWLFGCQDPACMPAQQPAPGAGIWARGLCYPIRPTSKGNCSPELERITQGPSLLYCLA